MSLLVCQYEIRILQCVSDAERTADLADPVTWPFVYVRPS